MAAIKVLPSNWRILILILEIGFLFVPDSEAAKGWSTKKVKAEGTDELTISCPASFHIIITYGEYGNKDHDCSDVFNQYYLALKCNYKGQCHFPRVDEGMKTACPAGVKKYLNLHYVCMIGHDELHYYLLTRGGDMETKITCPVNTEIYIAGVSFDDGKSNCSFDAKEGMRLSCWRYECNFYHLFEDIAEHACPESTKEIMIMYICREQERLVTSAFEGRPHLIKCPHEYKIDILSANYSDPLHDCKPNAVDTYIKKRCSAKQRCEVEQTTFSDFPSGCGSDMTELVIAYRCVQLKETRQFTVFENGLVDLSCFHLQRIKIIHARYGKKKKKCGSENVMERMIEMCNGKMSCCGTANADMLGESSCPEKDLQKLTVTYDCIDYEDIVEKDSEDVCENIRFKVSTSFGDLTSQTYTEMDLNLRLMIGTSLPRLKQMSMESYDGIIQYMKDIPSLEVIPGSSEERKGSYISGAEGFTDTISRTISKYEGIAWYKTFINSSDIVKDAHIDINYLAEIMTETGVAVKNLESLFLANEWKIVKEVDIAILRFPDVENPYFLVYHIHIIAWRTSDRVLFYEQTKGGLQAMFQCIKFRPNEEYFLSLEPDITDTALDEAESLFD